MPDEFQQIKEDVRLILTNHLPHLQVSITKLDERVKLLLWIFGVVGTVLIGDILLKR